MDREAWQLGHRPALDGVRAIAVLVVFAHHTGMLAAGYVGVDVFFVLSGFLITALLLQEHAATGRIRLGAFYLRRALRLAPALAALVTCVVSFGALTGLGSAWVSLTTAAGALLYVTNFLLMEGHYSALTHTWSLAIEEQFYLTWPLLLMLVVRRGRVVVFAVATTLTLAAVVWAHVLVGESRERVAFAFDARVAPILAGCALAAWMVSQTPGRSRLWAIAPASIALAILAWSPNFLADWRIAATTAASTLLLWGIVSGDRFAPLEHPALVWVGRRAYAVYLWHVPILIVASEVTRWPAFQVAPIVLIVTLLAASVSYTFVEEPFLRRKSSRASETGSALGAPTSPSAA